MNELTDWSRPMDDPLAPLSKIVPWEEFRPRLETHWPRGKRTGRGTWDAVFMFKLLIFGVLHDLPDDATAELATDSLSLMRFLELRASDPVPSANAIRLYRKDLAKAGVMKQLFAEVRRHVDEHDYRPRKDLYRPFIMPRWIEPEEATTTTQGEAGASKSP